MPAANSYSSPSTAGGNREYLQNILTVLEPEGTPVTSMIKKGAEMKGTYAEVLADTFRPARTNGRPEGQDAGPATNNSDKRQRFGNYPHIVREDFGVTEMQQAVETAAVTSEEDYQAAKAISQLKRDMEAVICGAQEMQQGSNEDEWRTRGLWLWDQVAAQATNPVPVDFRTPTASIQTGLTATNSISSLTEAQLNAVLQSMFTVYGKPMALELVGDTNTQAAVDNFSRVNSGATANRYVVQDNVNDKTITLTVKTFESSFGMLHSMPSMFVNIATSTGLSTACSGLILNMALLELQFLKGGRLFKESLPNLGGGPRGFAKAIFALCCKNPKGLGKVSP